MRSIAVVYNNLSFNGGTLSQLQLFNAYVRGDSLVRGTSELQEHVDSRRSQGKGHCIQETFSRSQKVSTSCAPELLRREAFYRDS
ncbi:hypothetical protein MPTK2_7g01730 [Marchantia polymorpha subsp. ruderalis]